MQLISCGANCTCLSIGSLGKPILKYKMAKFCETRNCQSLASITARLITQDLDKKTLDYYETMFLLSLK